MSVLTKMITKRVKKMKKIDESVTDTHVTLTCKNHPHLRWYTKNVDHIGARSIFFQGLESDEFRASVEECSCSAKDLVVQK